MRLLVFHMQVCTVPVCLFRKEYTSQGQICEPITQRASLTLKLILVKVWYENKAVDQGMLVYVCVCKVLLVL